MTQYRALDSRTACPWAEDTMKNRRSEITIKVTKEIQVSQIQSVRDTDTDAADDNYVDVECVEVVTLP